MYYRDVDSLPKSSLEAGRTKIYRLSRDYQVLLQSSWKLAESREEIDVRAGIH
jgi:hypothetical protein